MRLRHSNTVPKIVALAAVCLLWGAPVAAQEGLSEARIAELKSIASRVERDQKNIVTELRRLFNEEANVLRAKARVKADAWYRDGLPEYELENFKSYVQRLNVLHQLEQQDYSYIHNVYPIIAKRIITLDIVYKGRVEKDDVISIQGMRNIAREEFRDQLMGNLAGTYLASLAEPTPEAARTKILNFRDFIESMAASDSEAIELETDKIQRELDYFIVSLIPGVGDAMALAEAYNGTSAMGDELGWVDKAMAMVGVLGAVGDVASVVKVAGKFPRGAGKTLNLLSGYIDNLTPAQRVLIDNKYPGKGVKALENLSENTKVLRTPVGSEVTKVIDAVDPVGMKVARDAMAEQNAAFGKINTLPAEEVSALKKSADALVEAETPGLAFAKLTNPETMTDVDFNNLQKSLDLSDAEMVAIRQNPALAAGKIEEFTGVPIETLQVQAKVTKPGEFAVMRNSNPEGLNALKNKEAVPKPLFMKGKSGPGGAVYSDQEFSKMSLDLDAAEQAGDTALAAKIREKIDNSDALVESVTHEKELAKLQLDLSAAHSQGKIDDVKRLKNDIDTIESTRLAATSDRVGDKTIVAVMVTGSDGKPARSVMLRDKKGKLFDINTKQPTTQNASIVKNANGTDKTISRVVDKRTNQFFVADADAHILGFKGGGADDLLNEDAIGGYMTNTEKKRLSEITIAQKQKGLTPMMLHGGQVRYYAGNLDVDKTFYVIENGKIRIVRNNGEQLKNIVHKHRLDGNVAPVDPRWHWGKWDPEKGFEP